MRGQTIRDRNWDNQIQGIELKYCSYLLAEILYNFSFHESLIFALLNLHVEQRIPINVKYPLVGQDALYIAKHINLSSRILEKLNSLYLLTSEFEHAQNDSQFLDISSMIKLESNV